MDSSTGAGSGSNRSRDAQNALSEFQQSIATQIAAIQAKGREFLAQPGEDRPNKLTVQIGVGPDPNASSLQFDSLDCWDEDVICGKSETGYIHCTVHVCMEVGPVTVLPD